jgi:hypothetical protein
MKETIISPVFESRSADFASSDNSAGFSAKGVTVYQEAQP